jgi:hypothetical protein
MAIYEKDYQEMGLYCDQKTSAGRGDCQNAATMKLRKGKPMVDSRGRLVIRAAYWAPPGWTMEGTKTYCPLHSRMRAK